MAKWLRTLDIKNEWEAATPEEFKALAKAIAEKLEKLPDFIEEEYFAAALVNEKKAELEADFSWIAKASVADIDDFNALMEELYDWGDTLVDEKWPTTKVCWIRTTF